MKLSSRYNRVNILVSLLVLLLTGVIYYVVIHFILTEKLDRDLRIEEEEIRAYVQKYHKLPLPGDFQDQKVSYRVVSPTDTAGRSYTNSIYVNEKEHEKEPGRSLKTVMKVNDQLVEVTVVKSRLEAEDLVRIIFLISLLIIVLLLVTLFLVNRFLLNSLWRPFYHILDQMKAFNLTGKKEVKVEQSKIDEFVELNQAVLLMSQRVKEDYKELKSFTDNAAHEMMTPLAVINSKLDTLLQTAGFSDRQGELIEDIYLAVGRLSRLNHSLLLLAKIENNMIKNEEPIPLKPLIEQKLRQFQELLQSAEIEVDIDLQDKEVVMSKYLADILLNNLISNAIRHNVKPGRIEVVLTGNQLIFKNTGIAMSLDGTRPFERFNKIASSEGMGLGLAISRQICQHYGFTMAYAYANHLHVFSVVF
ncbi:HAMP domain-containing sensor histidine kinase [Pedobacter gandavensis]|uniref:sensor histidine kinase n=1 Tax=Pedobacter gandavensis TaxID=2679963 RepID=UPI002478EA89|nr:HAMP domain-containing sensor histidine kinase [Pedobacter gandavensis]WGQ10327.1 HAMP domain-containing sensor histidine kinase [Pedobacter gandavensis]